MHLAVALYDTIATDTVTSCAPTSETATFLDYELCGKGTRSLPEDNVRHFRNRLRGLRDRWRAGSVDKAEIKQRVSSWIAHAEYADTWRLPRPLSRGCFDPLREPDGPPVGRVLHGGSWNNTLRNARSAQRNRNDTTNRNDYNGFRLASTLRIAGAFAFTDVPGVQGSIQGPS